MLKYLRLNLAFLFVGILMCGLLSCDESTGDSWEIYSTIQPDKNFTPVGIANFKNYVIVSDSSQNRVIMYDWVSNKILHDLPVKKPVYINVRNSRMIIPSFSDDSIYIFRGSDLYTMKSFDNLNRPTGADAFSRDNYFIADQGNHRILYKLGHELELAIGEKGSEDGQFDNPSNILFWGIQFYVVDSGNKRVQVFSELGEYLYSFGEEEKMIWPTGISHNDEFLFISDMPGQRILVYDKKGKLVETIKKNNFMPSDISFFENKLYVADQSKNQIMVLEKTREEND